MTTNPKYQPIRDACRKFPHLRVDAIKERVRVPQGNEIYQTLMGRVFRGTDIDEPANYPKSTGQPF
jgi:hypothetical protein